MCSIFDDNLRSNVRLASMCARAFSHFDLPSSYLALYALQHVYSGQMRELRHQPRFLISTPTFFLKEFSTIIRILFERFNFVSDYFHLHKSSTRIIIIIHSGRRMVCIVVEENVVCFILQNRKFSLTFLYRFIAGDKCFKLCQRTLRRIFDDLVFCVKFAN